MVQLGPRGGDDGEDGGRGLLPLFLDQPFPLAQVSLQQQAGPGARGDRACGGEMPGDVEDGLLNQGAALDVEHG